MLRSGTRQRTAQLRGRKFLRAELDGSTEVALPKAPLKDEAHLVQGALLLDELSLRRKVTGRVVEEFPSFLCHLVGISRSERGGKRNNRRARWESRCC